MPTISSILQTSLTSSVWKEELFVGCLNSNNYIDSQEEKGLWSTDFPHIKFVGSLLLEQIGDWPYLLRVFSATVSNSFGFQFYDASAHKCSVEANESRVGHSDTTLTIASWDLVLWWSWTGTKGLTALRRFTPLHTYTSPSSDKEHSRVLTFMQFPQKYNISQTNVISSRETTTENLQLNVIELEDELNIFAVRRLWIIRHPWRSLNQSSETYNTYWWSLLQMAGISWKT